MPNKTATPIYNHAFSIGFSLESQHEDFNKIGPYELIRALQRRVAYLRAHPDEALESIDNCFDSYEVEPQFAEKPEPEESRYIVERVQAPDNWDDVSKYLKQDPRPSYRLVSVSVIDNIGRLTWERKDG